MVAPGGMCGCSGGAHVVAPGGYVWLLLEGVCGYSWGACVVAPGGHAWLLPGGHAWLLWGVHAWLLPGGHAWDTTRYGDTINERAVRILECILVLNIILINDQLLKFQKKRVSLKTWC